MPAPSLSLRPLLLGAAIALAACGHEAPPEAVTPTVLVQPASSDNPGTATFTGEVRARHEADLAFRVGGKLMNRFVDAGTEIRPGQALARLDPADLQLAASAAAAQLAAAESDYATANAERERYAGLLAQKFVSQAAFDAKENARNAARARLDQAHAQSSISSNQSAYGTLTSEYPAIVTAVLAEPGQVLAAGQPVLRVARPEEKEVAIAIPEGRVGELRAARDINVTLWAAPQLALHGQVREIAPAADTTTRTYASRIRIIDPPSEVRLGMTARISFGAPAETSLQVPLGAVFDHGQGAQVWVVSEGKVSARKVSIARYREDGAIIAEGLKNGELVVVAGTNKLSDGQSVTPRSATPPDRQR